MGFIISLNQTAGIVQDMLDGIMAAAQALISGYLMLFANWFYLIFLGLATILDLIQMLFKKMAGLDVYKMDGASQETSGDIALGLISNPIVMNIFWSLLILGIVLLIISTFIAVIKTEYEPLSGKPKSKGKIIGKAFRALFNFVTVPAVLILGLFVGNALLSSLDQATSLSSDARLSGRIFAVSAYDANRAREGVASFDQNFVDLLENENNFGLFVESNTNAITMTVADKIDYAFANNQEVTNTGAPVNFSNDTSRSFLYDMLGTPTTPTSFSIYNYRLVWYYYDLAKFNYIVGIGIVIMMAGILGQTLLGLVKRLYALTLLFVISPPIIAISPINDKAFGSWKSEFVKNALSAYAVIVTMNIFILLIPVIGQIQFFPIATDATVVQRASLNLQNSMAQMLVILGGTMFFKEFSKTIAGFIGAGDAFGDGAGASKAFVEKAGKAAAMATGVGMVPGKMLAGATKGAVGVGKEMSSVYKDAKGMGMSKWQAAAQVGQDAKARAMHLPYKASQKSFEALSSIVNPTDKSGKPMGIIKGNAARLGDNSLLKAMGSDKVANMLGLKDSKARKDAAKKAAAKQSEKAEKNVAANRHKELLSAMGAQDDDQEASGSSKANSNISSPKAPKMSSNDMISGYMQEMNTKMSDKQGQIKGAKNKDDRAKYQKQYNKLKAKTERMQHLHTMLKRDKDATISQIARASLDLKGLSKKEAELRVSAKKAANAIMYQHRKMKKAAKDAADKKD